MSSRNVAPRRSGREDARTRRGPEKRWRHRVIAAILVMAFVPSTFAAAHEGEYDPLVVDLHAFLTAEGRIDERAPAPGAVAFPASSPAAPGAPLRFAFDAPVRFAPGAAFVVALTLRADAPILARDAEGNALELNVEPGGTATRIAFDEPILAPGTVVTVGASVQAASALYAEGDPVTLVVRSLVPLADGALAIVTGPDASTFDAPDMRVPTPADLRLQDVPHTEFLLGGESFEPPATHAVNVFEVIHDGVRVPEPGAWSAAGTYVLLRGAEEGPDAQRHAYPDHARRVEAAHEFKVNGGDACAPSSSSSPAACGVTARVHPGLGVVVRVTSLPIRVECARNCPASFAWSYAPPAPASPPGDGSPGVLVPPPRDTSGIPVSEDEPDDRAIPFPFAWVALAVALARTLSKR